MFLPLGSLCGLTNGPLTMTSSAFLVVFDIYQHADSEFMFIVTPAVYIVLASQ